jgi:glucose-6-phosphate isomerase
MDHDAIAALLDRVASGGYGEMNPERRHQIVMVDDGQSGSRIAQYLARAIDFRCFASHSSRPEEQVIAVLQRSSPLWDLVPPGQWLNRFEIPDISSPELNMMTPVVLLPAAFLGLDCIQWLVGAMEMTQHFLEEPVESNQVLRFAVACDYLAGRSPGVNSPAAAHVFEASQQSLSELAVWCNHVVGPWNSAGPPTVPDDPDAHRRPAFDRKIRLNCTTHRHDRFPTLSIETKQGLGALLLESIGGWLAEPKQAMPQNPSSPEKVGIDIIFPRIDTRVLGQFFQMMGITSQITRMFVVAANTSNPST